MADNPQADDKLSDMISENLSEKPQETVEEMLSRHRKETIDLQNKEIALKKAAAKGSKAEQKAKKKQVDEEIQQSLATLKERQAKELVSFGYTSTTSNQTGNLDNLVKAIAGVSVSNSTDHSRPSKSVKRREKRAQQEVAREQRIQEEQSQIVSDRLVEDENLQRKIKPLGFTIHEIKPDGHCLYRAVENQLALHSGGLSPHTYQELRNMVAAYMRGHASEFLPFFLTENTAGESDDSLAERFDAYCREVESTASWGGQLELGALTHCLKKHVLIFSGSFPDVEMGKEYKTGKEGGLPPHSSIMLSYHRHAFGLGEHYNSVVPS